MESGRGSDKLRGDNAPTQAVSTNVKWRQDTKLEVHWNLEVVEEGDL